MSKIKFIDLSDSNPNNNLKSIVLFNTYIVVKCLKINLNFLQSKLLIYCATKKLVIFEK